MQQEREPLEDDLGRRPVKGQNRSLNKVYFFDKKKSVYGAKQMIEIDLYMSEPTYTDVGKKVIGQISRSGGSKFSI